MIRFRMREIVGTSVLAGARTGRHTLARLLDRIDETWCEVEPLYIDFCGVEIATASFLRESVIEFLLAVRRRWTHLYPVVANANDSVLEELVILVSSRRHVLVCCTLNPEGQPSFPHLLGELEAKQRLAFDLVRRFGEADASRLKKESEDADDVGNTAWNNRLAALNRLGVLMEISEGRTKRYRPLPLEK